VTEQQLIDNFRTWVPSAYRFTLHTYQGGSSFPWTVEDVARMMMSPMPETDEEDGY
jgi:hypothetical protein